MIANKDMTDEQFLVKMELSRMALVMFDIQDKLTECRNVGFNVSKIERTLYDMKAEVYLAMNDIEGDWA